ncbi:hypothetical protein [Treponema sp. R6D11]
MNEKKGYGAVKADKPKSESPKAGYCATEGKSIFDIDETDLESELKWNAHRYFEIGQEFVHAQREKNEMIDGLKICRAKVDNEIRERASGGEKLTEAKIANLVQMDEQVIEYQDKVNVALEKADLLRVKLEAWDKKISAVEMLCKLQIQGFVRSKG